jgi:divalent metal cation (Fe/Co/Zn/Cd) transporter
MRLKLICLRDVCLQAITWLFLFAAIIGIVLFLYGGNYYDPVVGWIGVFIFIASVGGFLAHYVYGELAKRDQKA